MQKGLVIESSLTPDENNFTEIRIEKGLIKASEDVIGQLDDICARAKKQAKSYNEGEQECGEAFYDDNIFGAYNRCMIIRDNNKK